MHEGIAAESLSLCAGILQVWFGTLQSTGGACPGLMSSEELATGRGGCGKRAVCLVMESERSEITRFRGVIFYLEVPIQTILSR